MSEIRDQHTELLDQLNEEFAEALAQVGIVPALVKEWGCSCTVELREYIETLGEPQQLVINVRAMPVWHFFEEGNIDLYIVQLTLPGMEHLTLSYNSREPIEGKMLEVF